MDSIGRQWLVETWELLYGIGRECQQCAQGLGGGWKANATQWMNSEIRMQFVNDFFPFAEPSREFLQPPVKASRYCPKGWCRVVGSASPPQVPPPHGHRPCGVPGERCYQLQEEHCSSMPCTQLLAKAPANLLTAAAPGRRAGCSSSECGSSHWWWQMLWGHGAPMAECKAGKTNGWLIWQSGPSSARTAHLHRCHGGGGLTCLVPGLWGACCHQTGCAGTCFESTCRRETCWLPTACNFGKMGAFTI